MKKFNKNSFVLLLFTVLIILLTILGNTNRLSAHNSGKTYRYPSVFPLTEDDKEWIEDKISSMSLYEKCAQMVMAPVYETSLDPYSPDYDSVFTLIKKHKIGGLIMFQGTLRQEIDFIKKAQRSSDIPLLISADYERGLGERIDDALEFPHAMAIGATLNSYFSYLAGRAIAEESRLIGVNQNFAPILDINNNYLNPVINIRSFSESKYTVSELASSFILGTRHGGIIATAKHFPGHGNTEIDSHTDLPMINGSLQYLYSNELFPFINAIKYGLRSIMVGHLEIPSVDTLPASLSKKIVTGLLQNQLGFDGLIVTDAFNMEAITKLFEMQRAIVLAVNSGNDIILMPPDPAGAVKIIHDAVNSGEISEDRIDKSVRKILSAKRWLKIGNVNNLRTDEIIDSVNNLYHKQLAEMIAEQSITLLKNDAGILPVDISKYKEVSCITVTDGKGDETARYYQDILEKRFADIKTYLLNNNSRRSDYNSVYSSVKNSDLILLPVFIDVPNKEKDEHIRNEQISFLNKILRSNPSAVIMSFKSPYILSSLPKATTYLNAYSFSYSSQNACLKAILGESDIKGKLPVSIPKTKYQIGSGIEMNKSRETKLGKKIDNNLLSQINSTINSFSESEKITNFDLCIGHNGNIIYQNAFSKNEVGKSDSSNSKTYNLGNLTAPLTLGSAVMLLIDDGLISLNDKVSSCIPSFKNTDKQNITIKNLLMHNSGLKSEFDSIGVNWNKSQLINAISNSKLGYATGSKRCYSILNDIVLQYLIERMSGKNLFDFLNERLFKPLGMENTFILETSSKNISNGILVTDGFRYGKSITKTEILKTILGGFTGADGLYSNTENLAVLAQMFIQNGYYNDKQYISVSSIRKVTSLRLPISYTGWQTIGTNLVYCGDEWKHGFGYNSDKGYSMWIDKDKKLFFILLSNSKNENMNAFITKLKCEIVKTIDER